LVYDPCERIWLSISDSDKLDRLTMKCLQVDVTVDSDSVDNDSDSDSDSGNDSDSESGSDSDSGSDCGSDSWYTFIFQGDKMGQGKGVVASFQ
jgi:hypothetical protein